jgi:hypothetical protein
MRRPLRSVVVVSLLALVVSPVLAWGCVLWSPLTRSRPLSEREAARLMNDHLGESRPGAAPRGSAHGGPGWVSAFAADMTIPPPRRDAGPRRDTARSAPSFFRQVPSSPDDRQVELFRAGWPLSCVEGRRTTLGSQRSARGLLAVPLERIGAKPMRRVPLLPVWEGLLANTAFFAALFWLAVPGQIALRRGLRRRRGRCPGCGYDVAHADHASCPECGEAS